MGQDIVLENLSSDEREALFQGRKESNRDIGSYTNIVLVDVDQNDVDALANGLGDARREAEDYGIYDQAEGCSDVISKLRQTWGDAQ